MHNGFPSPASVSLALLLLAPHPASALTERSDLEDWCRGGSAAAAGRCFGYLLAAEDALALGPVDGVQACLPADIGLGEQHRLVIQWLQATPPTRDQTALALVARAYASAYPCEDNREDAPAS
ncbi:Rap1a/Tai family immunity protein [Motiliproteus sp. SC1-56]|uniref:Rap1a/Tai family immunity protein n=1 Tax=Motiliproteus sp. SC1-56 TaxID=2799565 RepID=UPI001A8FEE10|nr:Rap1a/Tai family immunity protein [Motiliproteus sp. SC1-56]